jgi:hypothetical protein
MKFTASLVLCSLTLLFTSSIAAQESSRAADTAAKLRLQLIEVQTKEAELRARLQQLDEDLKPENIERALAGIGSTKPEELREHRRRQLTIERNGVLEQLRTVEASKASLESAIAAADSRAYQQSAEPSPAMSNQMTMTQLVPGARGLLMAGLGAIVILIGGLVVYLVRRT